jgi:DNA-binding CsgD family transcriptional regulator
MERRYPRGPGASILHRAYLCLEERAIENLGAADLRAVLGVVRELGVIEDLAAFRARLHLLVGRLVPGDNLVYNEVDPVRRAVIWNIDPPEVLEAADREAFLRNLHQHPIAMEHARKRAREVRTISDFIPRRQLHRLELYNEFFRYVDTEYQVTLGVPAPPPLLIAVSINRIYGDVSGRERAILEMLQPHASQAYDRVLARTRARQAFTALEGGAGSPRRTVVLLARDGAIAFADDGARRLLTRYFARVSADALPAPIGDWVRDQRDRSGRADEPFPPQAPLRQEGEEGWLTVRFVPAADRDELDALLLEEHRRGLDEAALRRLGLTRREREVLGRAAAGRSNAQIADDLVISPLTVKKHLEHIYEKLGVAKLGVNTRAAAIARAYDVA